MQDELKYQADVIVVGSGPGGATLARQLVRQGMHVLLLEWGIDHRPRSYCGTYLGALIYTDRRSLLFTKEGLLLDPIYTAKAFAGLVDLVEQRHPALCRDEPLIFVHTGGLPALIAFEDLQF